MRILIDGLSISRHKAGVGVYAKNLLDQLTRTEQGDEFVILAQDDDPEMDFSMRPGVRMVWVPARWARTLPLRFLLEQVYIPLLVRRHRVDVVHSLHYAMPRVGAGAKRVVTFHDMTFFTMPEVHQRVKVLYFQRAMRHSLREADHIIFISQSVQRDCRALLGEPRASTVIPHGKGEEFRPDQPGAALESVRAKYKLSSRFVLYVGTVEPRKNLPRLVRAFAPLVQEDPGLQLVLGGKMGWMQDELLRTLEQAGLRESVRFLGFVPEEDKALLLAACTAFVYPSLYEGFGLPALEALASGAPTITSQVSSLPEVVGDAAVLIDPTNVEALRGAMEQVLRSPELRAKLRRDGPVQAAKFTWERTAKATAAVYRTMSQSSRR